MTFLVKLGPTSEHPGIGLSGLLPDPRMRATAMLIGLAVTLWATLAGFPAHPGATAYIALGLAGAGWLALATIARGWVMCASIAAMAAGGGVVATTGIFGLIFVGVAASAAAAVLEAVPALALAVIGPAAFSAGAAAHHAWPGHIQQACTATLAGLLAGGSRRAISQRAANRAEVALARRRAELARVDAELAGERNRLARELHDVLAHTLGALSVQLTAIDTVARKHQVPAELQSQIERGTELVGAGLDEARQAVLALREDTTPLPAQLERLCALREAQLSISGHVRQLPAPTSLALYRLAQESLTNASKHAPGAPVSVQITYGHDEAVLSVRNPAPAPGTPAPLHESGGGYGLAGMRERITQAGGRCEAGPAEGGGWLVSAAVPYRREEP